MRKLERLCDMTTDETLHQTNCKLALAISINLRDASSTALMKSDDSCTQFSGVNTTGVSHGILEERRKNKKGANDVAFEKTSNKINARQKEDMADFRQQYPDDWSKNMTNS
uniref:Uncharacterized protein n=1 Tax=Glossina austeni TaxID=7395 RepID=A0A1A9UW32_GLOAU